MKFISILSVFLIFSFSNSVLSQENDEARVGEILKIGDSKNHQYSDVRFPKPNFIIKKGGIANYEKLAGTLVEITEIKTSSNNQTVVLLKRRDGKKFFGSFPEIKAYYNDAIASGELSRS
ncbi:hypothetical protein [Christiangramia sediminis]|uniref:Uncharacterized protein n=1 Tax=Christiangramia sediminis TaxID=2881336 RepID=A0A9X1LGM0_9FLAO|nr:hypothetical protein [Christiangramia sediminis]MCB7480026.1 hypothetical protein [Christiangramia sediminis]